MTDYKPVTLSTNLVEELEDIAKSNSTDIDNTVKLLLLENKELKNPSYLTTTKVSKNKSTYSSVIPAPIKNKFNLSKGQVLYWDIEDNKIIITPDVKTSDLPETPSILAGGDILEDVIYNNNIDYGNKARIILDHLNQDTAKDKPEDTLDNLKKEYFEYLGGKPKTQEAFKKVVLYLLDQPLEIYKHEILQNLSNEINKQNTSE